MPRRTKIPSEVCVKIPRDIVELYESPVLEVLFTPIEAEIAEAIIKHIKDNGRLWPDEWRLFCPTGTSGERRNYYRTIRKMLALGLLKRGKDNSLILSDELSRKLTVLLEKVNALTGAGPRV